MEILCGDDILTECDYRVGDTITGLKLQIMTESGSIWEPSPSNSLVIKADWNKSQSQNKKKSKGKKNTQDNQLMSLNLPDIKVNILLYSYNFYLFILYYFNYLLLFL